MYRLPLQFLLKRNWMFKRYMRIPIVQVTDPSWILWMLAIAGRTETKKNLFRFSAPGTSQQP